MFGFNKKSAEATKVENLAGQHATCESVWAGPTSPNHIRVLTETGLHPSGAADTLALCGAKVAWDLQVVTAEKIAAALPNQHETFRYCVKCVEIFTGISPERNREIVRAARA